MRIPKTGLEGRLDRPWEVRYPSNPDAPILYWMDERQSIFERRRKGESKPWTEDPILQGFRFCNVFREQDTVTIWIDENIRQPFARHEHLWYMLMIARTINRPSTLDALIKTPGAWPSHDDFEPAKMGAVLQMLLDSGKTIYTGAYMIRAESDSRREWYDWTKQRYIAELVLGRPWETRETLRPFIEKATTQESVWEAVAKDPFYHGWGPFMTYEWTTDLTRTRYLANATDRRTWSNPGPGALRGLIRLGRSDGRLSREPLNHSTALRRMVRLLERLPKSLPRWFPELELRDVEHSLCETDKYLRVWHGEGKPRSIYNGLAD